MKKIIKNKLIHYFLLAVVLTITSIIVLCNSAQADPVLLFSDLNWGPKTGWEGSSTKGAAVTIWGKNFGSSRGSSYVTINGAQLTSASDYAEWGATGPARGLERITFWVPSTASNGDGQITVTVGSVTSNALAFTVMTGSIYFISVNDGNNSYNGLYSTRTGHTGSDGPFKDIDMFNPSYNPQGSTGSYIIYVRGGTYTTTDRVNDPNAFVALRGPYGSSSSRHALIGYPAETPLLNTTSADGINWNADYNSYGRNSYFTFAKLSGYGGKTAFDSLGDYNRFIGNTLQEYLTSAWSGVIWATASQQVSIYGNYFSHNGYDSYKHNIYLKAQAGYTGDRSVQYVNIGYNEFNNPVAGTDSRGGAIFISRNSDAGSYTTNNIYVFDNYFHDGNMEFIYIGDNVNIGDVYIYNNIFKGGTNTNGGAISFAGGTNNVYLYNNVFYQTGSGAGALLSGFDTGGPLASRVYSRNNIFYSNSSSISYLYWDGASKGAQFNSDHDLFYNGGSLPSGSGITVTNSLTGNPLFSAPSSGDFTLQIGSPALNSGTSSVSSVVASDYVGTSRPQDSAYDIGVYETIGSGSTTPSTYTVGGSITGLNGTLVIQNNGSDTLTVSTNGSFTFGTALSDNTSYDVRVVTQPTGQTCTVTNGSGNVSSTDVTNISISCTNNPGLTYTLGGQISGLNGTVIIQNNGGNDLSLTTNGTFTFSSALSDGATYAVTVLTQPSAQRCTVSNGTGTVSGANVTSVRIVCVNTYTIGGSISGLNGGTVTLQNNSSDILARNVNGSFTFSTALVNGATYSVVVTNNPTGQTCTVSNGSGTVSSANVTTVGVTCVTTSSSTKVPSTVTGVTIR